MNEQAALTPPNFYPPNGPAPDQVFAPGDPFRVANVLPGLDHRRKTRAGRGRRSQTAANGRTGHYVGAALPSESVQDVAVAATMRAAALRLAGDGSQNSGLLAPGQPCILSSDLRVKVRRTLTGNLILFVVDASGSMGARKRMIAVKGAVLSLLLDAYQKRDRVGLITFRGQNAELLVPPTNSVELAEKYLRKMPTGGKTPLAAGLHLAGDTLARYRQKDASLSPLLVLVTDGRANVGQTSQLRRAASWLVQTDTPALVLDSEQGFVKLGTAKEVAEWLAADYMLLDQIRADVITRRVRHTLADRGP